MFKEWIANKDKGAESVEIKDKMIPILEQNTDIKAVQDILNLKHFLSKKSHWIFGGDGWAYDIGYGGLDHVLASGENVNILVLDTEVYSNTGAKVQNLQEQVQLRNLPQQENLYRKRFGSDCYDLWLYFCSTS